MNISILSGSPVKSGNTLKFSKAVKNYLEAKGHNASLIDFSENDISLPSQGKIDLLNLTPFQQSLKDSMSAANVVFIHSPEYNWMMSPEIMNLINQMSNRSLAEMWDKKVFAVAGISNGRGGKMPGVQLMYILNKIINYSNWDSVVSPRNFESHFTQLALNEHGASQGNAEYDAGLIAYIDYALKVAGRWHK